MKLEIKVMRNIILSIFVILLFWATGCQDVTIGNLLVDDASYKPDSLVIKSEASLDVAPPTMVEEPTPYYEEYVKFYTDRGYTREEAMAELAKVMNMYPTKLVEKEEGVDYKREKWGQPWVSTPIEGVEGTSPIHVSIKNITSTSGDASKLWDVLTVRGDGTFEIPLHHDVPAGRYVISLNFSNEGYSKGVDDCFTIIVK